MCKVDLLWQVRDHRDYQEEANMSNRYSAESSPKWSQSYWSATGPRSRWPRRMESIGTQSVPGSKFSAERLRDLCPGQHRGRNERRSAGLERLVGKKEVEIALRKILGTSEMTSKQKMSLSLATQARCRARARARCGGGYAYAFP